MSKVEGSSSAEVMQLITIILNLFLVACSGALWDPSESASHLNSAINNPFSINKHDQPYPPSTALLVTLENVDHALIPRPTQPTSSSKTSYPVSSAVKKVKAELSRDQGLAEDGMFFPSLALNPSMAEEARMYLDMPIRYLLEEDGVQYPEEIGDITVGEVLISLEQDIINQLM